MRDCGLPMLNTSFIHLRILVGYKIKLQCAKDSL